ncbi:MAG: type I DNA topoisomerase [Acidobacteria bacterium]|nr:type I DNA topoisomerase [Acidobacteriota bacterium]
MAKKLLIVESPAKSRTISKYLGKDFQVEATMGHIIDLPKSKLGVDTDNDFEPQYVVIPEKQKVVTSLKRKAASADEIFLAADPDREGEAICWHLQNILKKKGRVIHRVLFNEITKASIKKAVENPGKIDLDKFNAQQTRRIVDRLVGYKVSPLLWEKVKRGLSAGRVQTVALRIICEREKKIRAFNKEEYWSITGHFITEKGEEIVAKLGRVKGKKVRSGNAKSAFIISSKEQADEILSHLESGVFTIASLDKKEKKRRPLPPFITSKMQQEASRALGFSVKKTMTTAQHLYEGKDIGQQGLVGLITYMRTDSTRIAAQAIDEARTFISETMGKDMIPARPNIFAAKSGAQDAHEAIRPTMVHLHPDKLKKHLSRDELALYTLIWKRFVASQMIPAILHETIVTIRSGIYDFIANGTTLVQPGFSQVYNPGIAKDKLLPLVSENEKVQGKKLIPEQNFTSPPARFTEATLVKELESNGIGRPSTYASIISVIQNREYAEQQEKKFHPTALGELVNDILIKAFPDIFEVSYTAELENQLDSIGQGTMDWQTLLKTFYQRFSDELKNASETIANIKRDGISTDEKCGKCGAPMVIKVGRYGLFMACSNYPDCKNTRDLSNGNEDDQTEEICPKCGKSLVLKSGRYGKYFQCSDYPKCDYRKSKKNGEVKELDRNCPKCGKPLVERKGRYGTFVSCSGYPECRYIENGKKELNIPCPKCKDGKVVQRHTRKGKTFYGCSRYPDCDYVSWTRPGSEKKAGKKKKAEKTASSESD